jgi:hypothetical protein
MLSTFTLQVSTTYLDTVTSSSGGVFIVVLLTLNYVHYRTDSTGCQVPAKVSPSFRTVSIYEGHQINNFWGRVTLAFIASVQMCKRRRNTGQISHISGILTLCQHHLQPHQGVIQIQHLGGGSPTRNTLLFSLAHQGWPGPKNAMCIQRSLQVWEGVHWEN